MMDARVRVRKVKTEGLAFATRFKMKPLTIALALLSLLVAATAAEFHPILGVTSPSPESDLWPVSNLAQGPGTGFASDDPHDQLGSGASHRWVTDAPGRDRQTGPGF
jgi:hypothetical protein